jgi:hypothetical protein
MRAMELPVWRGRSVTFFAILALASVGRSELCHTPAPEPRPITCCCLCRSMNVEKGHTRLQQIHIHRLTAAEVDGVRRG